MALKGLVIGFTGTNSFALSKLIKENGGTTALTITSAMTHLITSERDVRANTYKVSKATQLGVLLVTEQWLHDSIKAGKRLPEEPYLIDQQLSAQPAVTFDYESTFVTDAELVEQKQREELEKVARKQTSTSIPTTTQTTSLPTVTTSNTGSFGFGSATSLGGFGTTSNKSNISQPSIEPTSTVGQLLSSNTTSSNTFTKGTSTTSSTNSAFNTSSSLASSTSSTSDSTSPNTSSTSVMRRKPLAKSRGIAPKVKAWTDTDPNRPAFHDNWHVEYYDTLQWTDIQSNMNKYYCLELHIAEVEGRDPNQTKGKAVVYMYRLYTHYGRTDDLVKKGKAAGRRESRFYNSLAEAEDAYAALIEEKTGTKGYRKVDLVFSNIGSDRLKLLVAEIAKEKLDQKKLQLQLSKSSISSSGSAALHASSYDEFEVPYEEPSREVLDLVDWIYQEANAALNLTLGPAKITQMGIETPLGVVTREQIDKGDAILQQLYAIFKSGASNPTVIADLTNQFYTLIPHNLGRSRDQVQQMTLNSMAAFEEKQELLQLMKDMLSVTASAETLLDMADSSQSKHGLPSELEMKYRALRSNVQVVTNETILSRVATFFENNYNGLESNAPGMFKIKRVYSLRRAAEHKAFKTNRVQSNQQTLFHGSRLSNYVGLLSRGLLMPKLVVAMGGKRRDAGLLGHGIYFADCPATSAQYCSASTLDPSTYTNVRRNTRLMLVHNVALGQVKDFTQVQFGLMTPPQGYNSVHGVKNSPSLKTDFKDNEYVIFDSSQQYQEFLVEFELTRELDDIITSQVFHNADGTTKLHTKKNQKEVEEPEPEEIEESTATTEEEQLLDMDSKLDSLFTSFQQPTQTTDTESKEEQKSKTLLSGSATSRTSYFKSATSSTNTSSLGFTSFTPTLSSFGLKPSGLVLESDKSTTSSILQPATSNFLTQPSSLLQPTGLLQPSGLQPSGLLAGSLRLQPSNLQTSVKLKPLSTSFGSKTVDTPGLSTSSGSRASGYTGIGSEAPPSNTLNLNALPAFDSSLQTSTASGAAALLAQPTSTLTPISELTEEEKLAKRQAMKMGGKNWSRPQAQPASSSTDTPSSTVNEDSAKSSSTDNKREESEKTEISALTGRPKLQLGPSLLQPSGLAVAQPTVETEPSVTKRTSSPPLSTSEPQTNLTLTASLLSTSTSSSASQTPLPVVRQVFPVDSSMTKLIQYFGKSWAKEIMAERKMRETLVSDRDNFMLKDHSMLEPLYSGHTEETRTANVRHVPDDEFAKNLPKIMTLYRSQILSETPLHLPASSSTSLYTSAVDEVAAPHLVVPAMSTFLSNLHLLTQHIFHGFNWSNVALVGSVVTGALMQSPSGNNVGRLSTIEIDRKFGDLDIELVLYGLIKPNNSPSSASGSQNGQVVGADASVSAIKKINEILFQVQQKSKGKAKVVRTADQIIILGQYPYRHITISLNVAKSLAEVASRQLVDCTSVVFDGSQVWVTPRASKALSTLTNVVDLTRQSDPTYTTQLYAWARRGFAVCAPGFEAHLVSPHLYNQKPWQVSGLARLLVYEKEMLAEEENKVLPVGSQQNSVPFTDSKVDLWISSSQLEPVINRDIYSRIRIHNYLARLAARHAQSTTKNFDNMLSSDGLDYVHFYLPWGPQWTAAKIYRHLQFASYNFQLVQHHMKTLGSGSSNSANANKPTDVEALCASLLSSYREISTSTKPLFVFGLEGKLVPSAQALEETHKLLQTCTLRDTFSNLPQRDLASDWRTFVPSDTLATAFQSFGLPLYKPDTSTIDSTLSSQTETSNSLTNPNTSLLSLTSSFTSQTSKTASLASSFTSSFKPLGASSLAASSSLGSSLVFNSGDSLALLSGSNNLWFKDAYVVAGTHVEMMHVLTSFALASDTLRSLSLLSKLPRTFAVHDHPAGYADVRLPVAYAALLGNGDLLHAHISRIKQLSTTKATALKSLAASKKQEPVGVKTDTAEASQNADKSKSSPTADELFSDWLNSVDSNSGFGILHLAVCSGQLACVETLLRHPQLNLNLKTKHQRWTALHFAAFYNYVDIARVLLTDTRGINVESRDRLGRTAAFVAAAAGNLSLLRLLHELAAANLDARTKLGNYSPLQVAASLGHNLVRHYLIEILAPAYPPPIIVKSPSYPLLPHTLNPTKPSQPQAPTPLSPTMQKVVEIEQVTYDQFATHFCSLRPYPPAYNAQLLTSSSSDLLVCAGADPQISLTSSSSAISSSPYGSTSNNFTNNMDMSLELDLHKHELSASHPLLNSATWTVRDRWGQSLLHYAILHFDLDVVQLLCAGEVDRRQDSNLFSLPPGVASAVRPLLDSPNIYGQTPIYYCVHLLDQLGRPTPTNSTETWINPLQAQTLDQNSTITMPTTGVFTNEQWQTLHQIYETLKVAGATMPTLRAPVPTSWSLSELCMDLMISNMKKQDKVVSESKEQEVQSVPTTQASNTPNSNTSQSRVYRLAAWLSKDLLQVLQVLGNFAHQVVKAAKHEELQKELQFQKDELLLQRQANRGGKRDTKRTPSRSNKRATSPSPPSTPLASGATGRRPIKHTSLAQLAARVQGQSLQEGPGFAFGKSSDFSPSSSFYGFGSAPGTPPPTSYHTTSASAEAASSVEALANDDPVSNLLAVAARMHMASQINSAEKTMLKTLALRQDRELLAVARAYHLDNQSLAFTKNVKRIIRHAMKDAELKSQQHPNQNTFQQNVNQFVSPQSQHLFPSPSTATIQVEQPFFGFNKMQTTPMQQQQQQQQQPFTTMLSTNTTQNLSALNFAFASSYQPATPLGLKQSK